MRWVKASEELPNKPGSYYCRDNRYGDNTKKVCWFYCKGRGQSLFIRRPEDIEWLDETDNKSQYSATDGAGR